METSNTNTDANRQPGLIALCTVMMILAIIAVLLRSWSVYVSSKHKFGYDDLFAILTLVSDT